MNRLRVRHGLPRIRSPRALVLAVCMVCLLPMGAAANSITVPFSGTIVGPDAEGATASGSVVFDWDENCTGSVGSFCQLGITLTYDPSGGTDNQGQVLAGVLWEPLGSADFRSTGIQNYGGVVGAAAIGGDQAGSTTFTPIIIDNTTYADISGHWGLNPAASLNLTGNFGTHLLSSVGSLFENLVTPPVGLGAIHLFNGTSYPSLETNPPNGSTFGIIDNATTLTQLQDGGFGQDTRVFAVGSIRANINYLGTLTGIDTNLVLPIFGTKGLPIPEPGTAALLGFGLLGLLGMGRRVGSRRS